MKKIIISLLLVIVVFAPALTLITNAEVVYNIPYIETIYSDGSSSYMVDYLSGYTSTSYYTRTLNNTTYYCNYITTSHPTANALYYFTNNNMVSKAQNLAAGSYSYYDVDTNAGLKAVVGMGIYQKISAVSGFIYCICRNCGGTYPVSSYFNWRSD